MLTQEILKQNLYYDKDTGLFSRIKSARLSNNGSVGSVQTHGYRAISVNGKLYRAHRLAWLYVYGEFPKNQIDHINGNRDDNRIENLREASVTQNSYNKRKPQGSNPYLGVTRKKRQNSYKWCARITVDKKPKHLGYFDCPETAYKAYLLAKAQYHNV